MLKIDETNLEVICLCGSTKFIDLFRIEEKLLTLKGKVVLSIPFSKEETGIKDDTKEKEMLMAIHRRKILMADRIHVINPTGYIGAHTKSEIKFAKEKNKIISYYARYYGNSA